MANSKDNTPEEIEAFMRELKRLITEAEIAAAYAQDAAALTELSAALGKITEATEAANNASRYADEVEYLVDDFVELDQKPGTNYDELLKQMMRLSLSANQSKKRAEAVRPRPEIKLVVQYHEQQQVDAFMPLRWCINKCAAEMMREGATQGLAYYMLLLMVHERAGEVDRRIVPLDAMMDYVRFNRAGQYTVYALVFSTSKKGKDEQEHLFSLLARQSPSSFKKNLFEYTYGRGASERLILHADWIGHETNFSLLCQSSISVAVPEQFFAKQPPAWLSRWVNYMFSEPPVDECHFKKRLIFAITIQPPLVAFWLIIKWLVGWPIFTFTRLLWAILAALLGVRPMTSRSDNSSMSVNWRASIGDYSYSFMDVWNPDDEMHMCRTDACGHTHHGGTVQFRDRKGRRRKEAYWWLLTPLIWILGFAIPFLIVTMRHWEFRDAFAVAFWWMLSVITALALVTFAVRSAIGLLGKSEVRRLAEEEEQVMTRKRKLVDAVDKLLCDTMPVEVDVSVLPPEQQTVRLRFLKIKARVCRPFAY